MKLIARSDVGAQLFELSAIPSEVWTAFRIACQALYKDDPEDVAVAKAIGSFITSLVDTDTRTILLTGIPKTKYEAFRLATAEAGLTDYRLLAELIQAAEDRRLVLAAPREEKVIGSTRMVVIAGFPEPVWQAWEAISEKLKEIKPGEYPVIMNILEFLLQFPKVAQISANPNKAQSPAGDFLWNAQSPDKST